MKECYTGSLGYIFLLFYGYFTFIEIISIYRSDAEQVQKEQAMLWILIQTQGYKFNKILLVMNTFLFIFRPKLGVYGKRSP